MEEALGSAHSGPAPAGLAPWPEAKILVRIYGWEMEGTSSPGDLMVGRGCRGGAFLSYTTSALLKTGQSFPHLSGLMSWRTRDYAKLKGEEVILGGEGKERAVTVLWDDPEGWYGEGGGRRVQDGEHLYTCGGFILIFGKTNTIM